MGNTLGLPVSRVDLKFKYSNATKLVNMGTEQLRKRM